MKRLIVAIVLSCMVVASAFAQQAITEPGIFAILGYSNQQIAYKQLDGTTIALGNAGDTANSLRIFNNTLYLVNSGTYNGVPDVWTVSLVDLVAATEAGTDVPWVAHPTTPSSNSWDVTVANEKVYVSNYGDGTVTVYDEATFEFLTTIEGLTAPEGLASNGDYVVVSNSGSAAAATVIDVATDTIFETITVGLNPQAVTVDVSGRFHVMCSGDAWGGTSPGMAVRYDPTAPEGERITSLELGVNPWNIAFMPNESGEGRVVVGNGFAMSAPYMQSYNPDTMEFDEAAPTGLPAGSLAGTPNGVIIGPASSVSNPAKHYTSDWQTVTEMGPFDQVSSAYCYYDLYVNEAPVVVEYSPEDLILDYHTDGVALDFSFRATDTGGEEGLIYTFMLDNEEVAATNTHTFEFTNEDIGERTITGTVTDPEGLSASVVWTVNVIGPDPWADEVVSVVYGENAGYGQDHFPDNILGPPDPTATSNVPAWLPTELLTLGHGGVIVLAFRDGGIEDGEGADFTVFENAFGSGSSVNAEPASVAVSEDGETWVEYPYDLENLTGLAGTTPTTGEDPTDPAVSGGDSFDLAVVGLSHAVYVKLTDLVGQGGGRSRGFDLDAVVAVNGEMGDVNDAPVIVAHSPEDLALDYHTSGVVVEFSFNATDTGEEELIYSMALDGQNVSNTNSYTSDFTSEDLGDHTIVGTATDAEGLSASVTWTVTVIIDEENPEITDFQPEDETLEIFVGDAPVTFSVVASDGDDSADELTCHYYLGEKELSGTAAFSHYFTNAEVGESQMLRAVVADPEGNEAEHCWTVTVTENESTVSFEEGSEGILAILGFSGQRLAWTKVEEGEEYSPLILGDLAPTAAKLRLFGNHVYVVNGDAFGTSEGGSIWLVDMGEIAAAIEEDRPLNWTEISIEGGNNPYDVLEVGEQLFVACQSGNKVIVLDRENEFAVTYTFENIANPQGLALSGSTVAVAASGLTAGTTLELIDLETMTQLEAVTVGLNPQWITTNDEDDLYVVCSGNYGDVAGSVYRVDGETWEATSTELNGAPGSIAFTKGGDNDARVLLGDDYATSTPHLYCVGEDLSEHNDDVAGMTGGWAMSATENGVYVASSVLSNVQFVDFAGEDVAVTYDVFFEAGVADVAFWQFVPETSVGDEAELLPTQVALSAAWPNPFNAMTTLTVSIPNSMDAKIALYNMLGQQVRSYPRCNFSAGTHRIVVDAAELASGQYIVVMNAGGQQVARRITLVR